MNNVDKLIDVYVELEKLGFKLRWDKEHFDNNPDLDFSYLHCLLIKERIGPAGCKYMESVDFNVKQSDMNSLIFYRHSLGGYGSSGESHHYQRELSSYMLSICSLEILLKQISDDFLNWQYGNDNSNQFKRKITLWEK